MRRYAKIEAERQERERRAKQAFSSYMVGFFGIASAIYTGAAIATSRTMFIAAALVFGFTALILGLQGRTKDPDS
jgi:hypothetical protein